MNQYEVEKIKAEKLEEIALYVRRMARMFDDGFTVRTVDDETPHAAADFMMLIEPRA